MCVDVRWSVVVWHITQNDLDPVLLARFDAELAEKERRQKEKREAHMYVSVKVSIEHSCTPCCSSSVRAAVLARVLSEVGNAGPWSLCPRLAGILLHLVTMRQCHIVCLHSFYQVYRSLCVYVYPHMTGG